jgi:serine/threonine protein kinase
MDEGGWGLQSIRRYVIDEAIGEGTYGKVYKGHDRHEVSRRVALKKMNRHHVSEGLPKTETREMKILKSLRHPNMVNLVEVVTSLGVSENGDGEGGSASSGGGSGKFAEGMGQAGSAALTANAPILSTSKRPSASIGLGLGDAAGDIFMVFEFVDYDLAGLLDSQYR